MKPQVQKMGRGLLFGVPLIIEPTTEGLGPKVRKVTKEVLT